MVSVEDRTGFHPAPVMPVFHAINPNLHQAAIRRGHLLLQPHYVNVGYRRKARTQLCWVFEVHRMMRKTPAFLERRTGGRYYNTKPGSAAQPARVKWEISGEMPE